MPKTFRVDQPCAPALLQSDLQASGVPVVTVRALWAGGADELAVAAVVVVPDDVDLAKRRDGIASTVAAHVRSVSSRRLPSPLSKLCDKEAWFSRMEKV